MNLNLRKYAQGADLVYTLDLEMPPSPQGSSLSFEDMDEVFKNALGLMLSQDDVASLRPSAYPHFSFMFHDHGSWLDASEKLKDIVRYPGLSASVFRRVYSLPQGAPWSEIKYEADNVDNELWTSSEEEYRPLIEEAAMPLHMRRRAQEELEFIKIFRETPDPNNPAKAEEWTSLLEASIPYDYELRQDRFLDKQALVDWLPSEMVSRAGDELWEVHGRFYEDLYVDPSWADSVAQRKVLLDMPNGAFWGKHRVFWFFPFPTEATSSDTYQPLIEGEDPTVVEPMKGYCMGEGYLDGPYDWYIWAPNAAIFDEIVRFLWTKERE